MLLLGVIQAQASGAVAGSFDLLETQVLSSSAASVTFSSLNTYAADYQHLQIRYAAKSSSTGENVVGIAMRYNGDSGNNYAFHILYGTGSSVASTASTSRADAIAGLVPRTTSSGFGAGVIDILDPFESTKYTTNRVLTGSTVGTRIDLQSGLWMNTAAVTSITLLLQDSSSFVTGSRFSLYGIKAA